MISDRILDAISLEGKVAVISGAASGIGLGMADALAAHGADVAICDRDEEGLVSCRAEIEALDRFITSSAPLALAREDPVPR